MAAEDRERHPVVRISVKGEFAGCGVLLHERLVLTCRHVIDDSKGTGVKRYFGRCTAGADVRIDGIEAERVFRAPEPNDSGDEPYEHADDLALLVLKTPLPNEPAVIVAGPLHSSVYTTSKLLAFRPAQGTPEFRDIQVEAASGLIEGPQIGVAFPVFLAGMSGGPVLIPNSNQCVGIAKEGGLQAAKGVVTRGDVIASFLERDDVAAALKASGIRVRVESLVRNELESHFQQLEERALQLPSFYPPHLLHAEPGTPGFLSVRQRVRVIPRATRREWQLEQEQRLDSGMPRVSMYDRRPRPELLSLGSAGDEDRGHAPEEFAWDEKAAEPQYRRTVILGDPGFGKTWLLRHEVLKQIRICRAQLEETPLLTLPNLVVPLWFKLPDLERQAGSFADRIRNELKASHDKCPTLVAYLGARLDAGNAFLALDGWDECSQDRSNFASRLKEWSAGNCRVLFTSRGARFGESPLRDAKELEMLPFERAEIDEFATQWFDADEQGRKAFLDALDGNASVNGLARIPLMLAMLCRVFQRHATPALPVRKVDLYGQAMWGLLFDWPRESTSDPETLPNRLQTEARLKKISALAYQTFPKERFDVGQLAAAFDVAPDSDEADRQQRRLVREGLIVKADRDGEYWQFLHRTFHEYLAAKHLAERANKDGWSSVEAEIQEHAPEPLWAEVIPLLAGQMKDPTPLIKWLGEQQDIVHRPLALAIRCLAEAKNFPAELANKLIDKALNLWKAAVRNGLAAAFAAVERVMPWIAQSHRATFDAAANALLDDPESSVRAGAAAALGQMGEKAATAAVTAKLVAMLDDSDSTSVLSAAAALGRLGEEATKVGRRRLVAQLDDQDGDSRHRAAYTLAWMGATAATEMVLAKLVTLLTDDSDGDVDRSATLALASMGEKIATAAVMARLFAFLSHPRWRVRSHSASLLGVMGEKAATEAVLTKLVALLDDPESSVRWSAAEALGEIGEKSATATVLAKLVALLDDPDALVRRPAASALAALSEHRRWIRPRE